MACNEYHGLTDMHRRHVITYKTEEKAWVHLSISCNHCRNPVCVSICPENNFKKRRDGIVVHHADHCRGCMRCIKACPFHAPKLNPRKKRAEKCNLCVERIDRGLKPVCVENCITKALGIIVVNPDDINNYAFNNTDMPIKDYTKPSIFVIKKQTGKTFLRKC